MTTRHLLAVDLGASGGKCFAGIFRGRSFRMEEIHRFSHESVPFYLADHSGRVSERLYWDDTLIHHNILLGLHEYRRRIASRLDGIGIDAWGADGAFFNRDGEMLGKVYCYRDHRLDRMIEEVQACLDVRRIYTITGNHFQPFNLTNQLLWFVRNRQDLLIPGSFFLPLPSIFYYYLGGMRIVDSTWASVSQLMDARRGQWSSTILRALGVPRRILPRIVPPGWIAGTLLRPLAQRVGLNAARLIAVASHDTASAFAAAPVTDAEHALIISSGTWSLIGRLIPRPNTSVEAQEANLSNEGGIGNIRFLRNCMGTWMVQELRRVWRLADGREASWEELNRLTEQAQPFTAFVDPDDPGFYNPTNMEQAIVRYCRRTRQPVPTHRGTFLRIAYESLAMTYRSVNEAISRICGTATRVVHIVGGGSQNVFLNQCTADALGVPVLTGPVEATAVGNFMVQALGLGLLRSLAEAQPVIRSAFPIREYRPRATEVWERAYARFLRLRLCR